MKKHHFILLCTALFILLFYGETFVGVNLGILGIAYSLLTFLDVYGTKRFTKMFVIFFITSVLSSVAFAWYGDFSSFLAVVFSLGLLTFKAKNKRIKPILLIPVFIINVFTFICRVFDFSDWLPKKRNAKWLQSIFVFVFIPGIFVMIFLGIYTLASQNFSDWFTQYELDINIWELIILLVIGFVLAFNYRNFKIEKPIYKAHYLLDNNFSEEQKNIRPTYSFIDIDLERKGGVVTFILLNILLLIFIITYNYEQFYEVSKSPSQLSQDTHERVYAVIFSIIMAIFVIMFYFKSSFNFDNKAKTLKHLAYFWIILNGVLVLSAILKNTEYISELGLTYKRLGVYGFLGLSIIGLVYTFFKIKNKRTNAYLFNVMFLYFYATILLCSFINWGNLATIYNINNHKGDYAFYKTFNFNEAILFEKYPNKDRFMTENNIKSEQGKSFLSKKLYYYFINFEK
ncbi:MAG: DUF4173 domain-containing protein [Cruoricaptor ignavus]|nr:DUF4173 domain-containing protein [Cruoricaptor ignavus]